MKVSMKRLTSTEIALISPDNEGMLEASKLHNFLQVKSKFRDWIKNRILKYQFIEGKDYKIGAKVLAPSKTNQVTFEYYVSVNMAKELCMLENNDQGRSARAYFIECEARLKREPIMPEIDIWAPLDVVLKQARDLNNRLRAVEVKIPEIVNTALIEKAKHSDLPEYLISIDELGSRLGYAVNSTVLRDSYDAMKHPRGSWTYTDKNGDVRFPCNFERDLIGETEAHWLSMVKIHKATDKNYIATNIFYEKGEQNFYIKRNVAENDQKIWRGIISKFKGNKFTICKD